MQKKIIIYQSNFNEVGGCETFIYNLVKQLKNWYDILVIYDTGNENQLRRISKQVPIEIYDKNKEYRCDILFQNSMWGKINDMIISPRIIGMVHTDYQALKCNIDIQFDKINEFVACGLNASNKFTEKYNVKCVQIVNILDLIQPTQKVYHFVSAGRLSDDKGWDKMQIMINMLRKEKILFDWKIFTNNEKPSQFEEVTFLKPRYDIWNYLKDADYGVLLSQAEGYPYFVSECLQYGTPVIGTDVSGTNEIIKHKINGYLVPINMDFDINIIKTIPKVENYSNETTIETWKNYLENAEYKEKGEREMKYEVIATKEFTYGNFDKVENIKRKLKEEKGKIFKDDIFTIDEEQYFYLFKNNVVKLIREIEIKENEIKEEDIEVEEVKKTKKTTKKK